MPCDPAVAPPGTVSQVNQLMFKEAVPNPDCYTGEMVIINKMIGSNIIPICEMYLKSDLISGFVR